MNSLMRKDGKYLITGGSGFLGSALIERLFKDGFNNLVALSWDENELIRLKDTYGIEIVCGDISDPYICARACKGVAGVFHLAAFKLIEVAEVNAKQCVTSNVIGMLNILNETLNSRPDLFVFVSTDKAAQMNGVYGATKYIGERLTFEYSTVNPLTQYRVVRFGNVWASTGSFITRWAKLMELGKEITLTDPRATRFFFKAETAVDFILRAISEAPDARPMLPQIKAISMGTVLEACQEVFGKCPVKIIGLRLGENMHETMDGKVFSNQVEQYTKEEFKREFLSAIQSSARV